MNCQICNKNQATVHVTDVASQPAPEGGGQKSVPVEERHVCSICAQSLLSIVVATTQPKVKINIWKLLEVAKQKSSLACPDCGMTLAEFRNRGKLGCPRDYELFWPHLEPLLERVHNATQHLGRIPGADEADLEKKRHLTDLRAKLEAAIQEEAYEDAAELRDAIQELERTRQGGD